MIIGQRINLIPQEFRPKVVVPIGMVTAGLVVALFTFVSTSTIYFYFNQHTGSRRLAAINAKVELLSAQVGELELQKERETIEVDRYLYIVDLMSHKSSWSRTFRKLSTLIPQGVWLTGLSNGSAENPGQLILKGETTSQELMARFFSALENSGEFGEVIIKNSERAEKIQPPLYRFEFSIPVAVQAVAALPVEKGGG